MINLGSVVSLFLIINMVLGENICCKPPTKKFQLSRQKANFFQAFINCKVEGMELAAIENEDDSKALDSYLDPFKIEGYNNGFWLSGTHLNNVSSRQYYWLSSGKIVIYSNWISTEPDNSLGRQHAMFWTLFQGKTGWADDAPEKELRYVCEY